MYMDLDTEFILGAWDADLRWHLHLASPVGIIPTRSTRGEVDGQDGTYPPLQTIGMELLEVGRARFFVLHIAARRRRWAPVCVALSKTKKLVLVHGTSQVLFVFMLQLPVAAVLSKVQIKFVTLV